jgi:Flp pilus assembly protein TadD
LLSDLGWALVEGGQYDEAEQILRKAVDLSPPENERPRHNLEQLARLKNGT